MSDRLLTKAEVRLDGADGPSELVGFAALYYDGTPDTEYVLWESGDERAVERIAPGAFDEAIRRDEVVALYNHDDNNILGRTSANTLQLESNETGLFYRIDIPDTQIGRDVTTLVQRRDVQGSSFQFGVDSEEFESKDGTIVRTITKVKPLVDVGPVSRPAYRNTSVDARDAKSRIEAYVRSIREDAELETWRLRKRMQMLGLIDRD